MSKMKVAQVKKKDICANISQYIVQLLLTIIATYFCSNYVSPMKWGDILFLAPLSVCPSVRLSVRLSVRHTFVSALYLLNPWWDFQITLHKCQV